MFYGPGTRSKGAAANNAVWTKSAGQREDRPLVRERGMQPQFVIFDLSSVVRASIWRAPIRCRNRDVFRSHPG